MASDEQLASFVESNDEEAFRQLAERYSGMVYASALRRTGSPEAAEEIVQNVFIALARKAASLLRHPSLSGWLFRATMLESANYVRRESKRNEKMKAFENHQAEGHEGDEFSEIPKLDEALDRLPEADRNLLLLRYFDRQGFREIAVATGKSEVASRKQSERALAKLRKILQSRGVQVSGAVLATALGAQLGGKAPAGIAALAAKGAALAAASPVSAPFFPSLVGMITSTSKVALFATAALFLAVGGGGYYAGLQQVEGRQPLAPDQLPGQQNLAQQSEGQGRSSGFFPDPTLDRLRFLIRTAGADHRLLEFRLAVSGLSEAAISDLLQYSKGKLLLRDEEDRSIYASLLSALVAVNPEAFEAHVGNSPELGLSTRWGAAVLSEVVASWVLKDQEAAVAWVRGTMAVHRSSFLIAMIESIGDRDRSAALALFRESVSDGMIGPGKWDSGDFFREWAKDDPVGAINEALAIRELTKNDKALHQSVMAWSRFDPEKARQWVDEETGSLDDVVRNELIVSLVNGWAETAPEAAATYLMEIEDPATQERAAHFLLRDWVATSFDEASGWIASVEDPERRDLFEYIVMVATRDYGNREEAIAYGVEKYETNTGMFHALFLQTGVMVDEDPHALAGWAEQNLPKNSHTITMEQVVNTLRSENPVEAVPYLDRIPDPLRRELYYERVGKDWAADDLESARDWVNGLPDSADRDRAMAGVASAWIEGDVDGAADWIRALDPGGTRDRLAHQFVKEAPGNVEVAFQMAEEIEHPLRREEALETVARAWLNQDSEAARAGIGQLEGLSDTIKWRLLGGTGS